MTQDINASAANIPTVVTLRSKTQSLLEPRLKLVFEDMAEHLFNLSASAQINADNRSRSFEAFSLLRAQHKTLIKTLLARIDRGFDNLVGSAKEESGTRLPTELDLVDLNEFESNLAIDRMVKLGNERYWLPLEAITLRLAAAIDVDPKSIQLPFGLKVCFSGYRSVLAPLEFNEDILNELDKAFARNLLPELREVYQQLNALLADAGLLPTIEEDLENSGSKLEAKSGGTESNKPHPAPNVSHPDAETEQASAQPDSGAQRQTALHGARHHRSRGTSAPPATAVADVAHSSAGDAPFLSDFPDAPSKPQPHPAPGSTPGDINTIDGQMTSGGASQYATSQPDSSGPEPLGPVFDDSVDRSAPALSPLDQEARQLGVSNYLPTRDQHRPTATLGSGLLNRLRSPGQYGGDPAALQTADQVITQSQHLVDRLISMRQRGVRWTTQSGKLVDELGLSNQEGEADASVNSVALVDQLFATLTSVVPPNPPVVDSLHSLKLPLAQLSLTEPDFYRNREHPARLLIERLTELAALTPQGNTRIESKLNEILDQLNTGYDGTHEAFDKALSKVTELALTALRQQQRAIQRQVAADDGKEKRRVARAEVARGLATAMPQVQVPTLLLALVETVLHDGLTLRILRSGKDTYYLDVLAALARINGALLQEQPLDLVDASDAVDIIKRCLAESELLDANSEQLLGLLLSTLTSGQSVDLVVSPYLHTDIYAEPQFSERLRSLPRLSRWVKRARELPVNSWLSSTDEQGIISNRQLIWRNDSGTRFTLANEQGQGVEHLDLLTLAKRLATKLKPLKASEQLSIIERSVFSTLEEKQADLLSVSRKQPKDMLSRAELVDKVQSMLRRARRRGANYVAAAVPYSDDSALAGTIETLSQVGLIVEYYGKLNNGLAGLVINSQSTAAVKNGLNTLIHDQPQTKYSAVLIEPSCKDGHSVWQGLEDFLHKDRGDNDVTIEQQPRQRELAAAVVKTYSHLCDDMPPRFSLRQLVRHASNDSQNAQLIFQVLLDGTADTGAEVTRQSGYHSTALAIALDCAKVASVTQLAELLTNAGREIPVFNIRIATDSALHHDFLEFALNAISDSGIGTDRLCIELTDSTRLREASRAADFARALRSIGCQVCVSGVHPSRGSTAQLQALSPHMLILDASLWPPAEDSHLASLNQAISDLHHLVGEHVVLRDDRETARAVELGIDLIESQLAAEIAPQDLVEMQPVIKR